MASTSNTILWADDEIDILRPHILFLEQKGFSVIPASNGEDAISLLRSSDVDLVFLDEQMPGMDGLTTLVKIKEINPLLPVVMITKSEEEQIMEEAIGNQISDYLIKPVNPKQILLTIKRILDRNRLRNEKSAQSYLRSFNQLSFQLNDRLTHQEWIEIYRKLTKWDIELEQADENLRQVLDDQISQANHAFGKFVEEEYRYWVDTKEEDRPVLSPDIMPQFVFPHLKKNDTPVIFIIVDCLRYDQWLIFEKELAALYSMETDFYYSILPTATPYARNAIFSGLFPSEIHHQYPHLWENHSENEASLNQHEETFLGYQLRDHRLASRFKYEKIVHTEDGKKVVDKAHELLQIPLSALVFNFVDTLVHSRSDSAVLKEIAPDMAGFRSLTRTWFRHSNLFNLFKTLAEKDVTIVLTTDHGSVRALRDTKVLGDKDTSTSLRYKFGRSLKSDSDASIIVQKPEEYKLPKSNSAIQYIFAKEDYYFVYPTNYHRFQNRYNDTFQHGGASMEEMILPVVTMRPK